MPSLSDVREDGADGHDGNPARRLLGAITTVPPISPMRLRERLTDLAGAGRRLRDRLPELADAARRLRYRLPELPGAARPLRHRLPELVGAARQRRGLVVAVTLVVVL